MLQYTVHYSSLDLEYSFKKILVRGIRLVVELAWVIHWECKEYIYTLSVHTGTLWGIESKLGVFVSESWFLSSFMLNFRFFLWSYKSNKNIDDLILFTHN